MKYTVRPHGLTALAVLNFIFGGFKALGLLFGACTVSCISGMGGMEESGMMGQMIFTLIMDASIMTMLIMMGVLFLRVSRWSVWAANLYVLLVIVQFVVVSINFPVLFGSMTIVAISGFVYPFVIFIFINLVFMDLWRSRHPIYKLLDYDAEFDSKKRDLIKQNILVIGLNSFRQSLRSASGVIFCVVVLYIGLLAARALFAPIELYKTTMQAQMPQITDEQYNKAIEDTGVKIIAYLLDDKKHDDNEPLDFQEKLARHKEEEKNKKRAEYMLKEKPGFLSMIFLIFCILVPLIVVFAGFNQISGDNANKGLRYLLLRAKRHEILLGKYIGSVLMTMLVLLFLFLTIMLYVLFTFDLYSTSAVLSWTLWGYLAMVILSLPFLAFALLFSAIINSSIGSLAASFFPVLLYPIIIGMLVSKAKALAFLPYFMPHPFSFKLFMPGPLVVAGAAAALIGYTGAYLVGAAYLFNKRSL